MILLGLSGKKQSGKDTCAEMIAEALTDNDSFVYHRLAFADALYEEVANMVLKHEGKDNLLIRSNPLMWPKIVGDKIAHIKANKADYRLLLQWWGTDYRRKSDPDYWIKRWLDKFRALPDNSFVVVPDVRFHNELSCIINMGGFTGRVIRSPVVTPYDTHPSECELDDVRAWIYRIENFTTLETLKSHMTSLTKQITTKYK